MTHMQRTYKARRGMIVLAVAVLALLMGAVVLPHTKAWALPTAPQFPVGDTGTKTATVYTNAGEYSVSYSWVVNERTQSADFGDKTTYETILTVDVSALPTFENFALVPDYEVGSTLSSVSGDIVLRDWAVVAGDTIQFRQAHRAYNAEMNFHFTCTIANYVPLPEPPTKEGYTFTGWYTDEACTNKYVGETVRDDMTLYAGWQINRYTVTYDSAGGTYCESATVDWNTSPTLPTPTRTGYTFVGWFDGETQYTDAPVKANKNLVAHWEIMTFTVTFMSDGTVYKTITVDYGTSLVEAMETAEIASYAAYTDEGARLSKLNSVITENTQILVQDLSGWEKYGDFVARSPWYTWLTVGVLGALAVTTVVMAIVIKRG